MMVGDSGCDCSIVIIVVVSPFEIDSSWHVKSIVVVVEIMVVEVDTGGGL